MISSNAINRLRNRLAKPEAHPSTIGTVASVNGDVVVVATTGGRREFQDQTGLTPGSQVFIREGKIVKAGHVQVYYL